LSRPVFGVFFEKYKPSSGEIMSFRLSVLLALALAAGTSSAQNIKPGLWEIKNKMQSGNVDLDAAMAQMQKQLANMPPEQRKMMEDAMARQGVNLSTSSDGGIGVKMCMTKEMVAQNKVPMQQQGDCTHTQSPMVGNTMKITFNCSKPPSSGEGQVTYLSDTAYKMNMKVTSTQGGKTGTMSMDGNAKWLGADCGNIKPIQMPPAGK
jgi:hypothetical protein